MHLGNGAITPECAALTASIAAAGLGFAAASLRHATPSREKWLAAGVYGALIFAAQMLNVPVLPYSSGHFVGGVLLAIALSPGLGALTMTAVLVLQAVLLGDGGVMALGANTINMALLPAGMVALGKNLGMRGEFAGKASLTAGLLGSLAVFAAAILIVIETALFRTGAPIGAFAQQMLLVHLPIGLAEGLLTGAVVYAARGEFAVRSRYVAAGALTVAVLLALPLASQLPDGYEASAERAQWQTLLDE